MLIAKRRVHMVGIGGAGMSALAEILVRWGYTVSGSDREESTTTRYLESLGIQLQYDHKPRLVKKADLLVYSSAVDADNLELQYAHQHSIRVLRRAEALGELMRSRFTVAVAGTHGKTTTTSLIGHLLTKAGLNPSILVGGVPCGWMSNAVATNGLILVAEADEYDRSFLKMYPSAAVVTNIEPEHLDCYSDIEDIKEAFIQFINKIPFFGAVVCCSDNANIRSVIPKLSPKVITYGLTALADYRGKNIRFTSKKSIFTVYRHGKQLGEIEMLLPGIHNVRNALGAIAICCELGVDFDLLCKNITSFAGVKRRFEIKGIVNGITIIDDYAHHPDEIEATADAASRMGYKRIVAVFQPHLYSRTKYLAENFARSLMKFDCVIVTEIYRSREKQIPGVSGVSIVSKMKDFGHKKAFFIPEKRSVADALVHRLTTADALIVMGAGDIWKIVEPVMDALKHG